MPAKKPTTPKATKEPKMPETKETKSPLYTAVRDILEAKDRETLDARTDAKVSAVLGVLEGPTGFPVGPLGSLSEAIAHEAAPAPVTPAQVPWSLDGLVIDPGEEAVGQWGFFFGEGNMQIGCLHSIRKVRKYAPYLSASDASWSHFAVLPGFDFTGLHSLMAARK